MTMFGPQEERGVEIGLILRHAAAVVRVHVYAALRERGGDVVLRRERVGPGPRAISAPPHARTRQ
jgi:hypothetical protein